MEIQVHPLDPLSKSELEIVVTALKSHFQNSQQYLIAMVQVEEPSKPELAQFKSGIPVQRAARVTVLDKKNSEVHECVVTVDGKILSTKVIEGAKAPILSIESEKAVAAVKADPRIIAALKKRGIGDVSLVQMETWSIGAQIPEHLDDGRRLIWTPMWLKPEPKANFYAHPIAGLHAIVDLANFSVVAIEDDPSVDIPQTPGPYRESQTGATIQLKPLSIHQPEGVSFVLDGHHVTWERWNFRVGFCQREGLVLHDVWFDDENKMRKIAHRLSIAELVIPYGDQSQGSYRKNAFDTGEFGLGNYTNSLTLGCDCLGEIVYLDVAVVSPSGEIREIGNAICMHEEDFGILWKHTDVDGNVEVRRGRRFVVSSIVTINNYEYGYFWYFYQDGSIEFEAKLTGIVLTLSDNAGADHPSATEIEPGLWAPYHQHIFCARLDLDIDGDDQGSTNTVVEVDSYAHELGPKNLYGGAYETKETTLSTERKAQRLIDPMVGRFWKVINPNKKNHVGKAVGYKLIPGHTTFPLALPDSVIGKRAGFMYKHLWVTPHQSKEKFPAGDYPYQHAGGAGIPEWTKADRGVENTDVVLWYVFGTNHIPRTEDWPVMPVERTGFHLKPSGFFRRSPGIDVAASPKSCH